MFAKYVLAVLFLTVSLYAYEIPDENEVTSRTCRIKVNVEVVPDTGMQNSTGRAKVMAALVDDEGNPYRLEKVRLSANAGTFVGKLPEDTLKAGEAEPADCFTTGYDGVARLYLVNIPLNVQVKIMASYDCDGHQVSSYATMSISRGVAKKKVRVMPKSR